MATPQTQPYPFMRQSGSASRPTLKFEPRAQQPGPPPPAQGLQSPAGESDLFDRDRLVRDAPPLRAESHAASLITIATLLPAEERRRVADALARSLATEDPQPPVANRTRTAVAERFQSLAAQWRAETAVLSSITEKSMHPAYQRIIGLGPEVVPLLLRELRRAPDHWFWALKAITDTDPVPTSARGRLREMAECWLKWGEEQGLSL